MIHLDNHAHARMISEKAGCVFNPAADHVISRTNEHGLLGGVVFQGYTGGPGGSIEMQVAGDGPWLSKDLLWYCFDYPFNQLGCTKVFALIPMRNKTSIEFARRLGFKWHQIIKDVYPDCDLVILDMYREQCRWLTLPRPRVLEGSVDGQEV